MTPFDKAKQEAAEKTFPDRNRSGKYTFKPFEFSEYRIHAFELGADWAYAFAKNEDEELVRALEHYECSHYDHRGCPCYGDKTAREALAKYRAAKGEL